MGNATGKSEPQTFVINTKPPEVTFNTVPTPSNNTKPAFSGTASESLPVTVKIYKGLKAEGAVVATAEAPVSSKKWGPVSSATALTSGTYTAMAEEASSLGNATGESEPQTFVDQHETAGSDVGRRDVAVERHDAGIQRDGERIAAGDGEGLQRLESRRLAGHDRGRDGGEQKLGAGELFDRTESGEYTAVAEEESSLGNGSGKSAPVTFVINTKPPEVTLAGVDFPVEQHETGVQRDGERNAAGDRQDVRGSKAEGSPVATAEGPVSGKKWGPVSSTTVLTSGTYTAVAEEASSLGNSTGKSETRTFVVNTEPPEVSLAAVPSPSNDTTPSLSGTASESMPVTVKVYKGSEAKGSPVASAETTVSGGKWGPVEPLARADERDLHGGGGRGELAGERRRAGANRGSSWSTPNRRK